MRIAWFQKLAVGLPIVSAAFLAAGCRSLPWCGPPRLHTLAYIHRGNDILALQGAGRGLRPGAHLPNVTLIDRDFQPVSLSSYRGRVLVISTVPSLDTPVCRRQTRYFNEAIGALGPAVALVTVSEDLPFAQKRFCAAEGIENSEVLSDYRTHEFARVTGLYIKDLALLARAVVVVDPQGVVRYIRVVPDLGQEPDYAAVMAVVRELLDETPDSQAGENSEMPAAADASRNAGN